MRKIEQQMIAAIRAGKSWSNGNTRVAGTDHAVGIGPHEDTCSVYLHGNWIAHVDLSRGAVRFTLAGWPTPTTRSRINALLKEFVHDNSYVGQRAGVQVFASPHNWQGDVISAHEWVQA